MIKTGATLKLKLEFPTANWTNKPLSERLDTNYNHSFLFNDCSDDNNYTGMEMGKALVVNT